MARGGFLVLKLLLYSAVFVPLDAAGCWRFSAAKSLGESDAFECLRVTVSSGRKPRPRAGATPESRKTKPKPGACQAYGFVAPIEDCRPCRRPNGCGLAEAPAVSNQSWKLRYESLTT